MSLLFADKIYFPQIIEQCWGETFLAYKIGGMDNLKYTRYIFLQSMHKTMRSRFGMMEQNT